jgi:hypothetical protein
MAQFVTQDKVILYTQPDGPSTSMKPLSIDKNGMADVTIPGPGREVVWGRDVFGQYLPKITVQTPPGGLITTTIEEDDTGVFSYLAKMFERTGCFPVQRRWYKCGRLDGNGWDRITQYGKMTVTQKTEGAGPSRDATGAVMFNSYEVASAYAVNIFQHTLSALTISEDQNINDIAFLSDLVVGCNDCFPGYQPDEIGYLAVTDNAGSPGDFANVWYTTNGGGAWAITSTNPFAALDAILFVELGFISSTQFRVIVVSDAATAQVTYSDFTLGAEGTSSWASAVTIGAAAVEAFKWLFYDRLYAAVAGDIYVSSNQAETFAAAIYTGSVALNAFARSPVDDSVIATGASNTILQEKNQSGTFTALVGPAAGGAFTKGLFIANDGRIYAGNGTSIYLSTNTAANAGGWTQLKDFGANKSVVSINCAGGTKSQGGDSQLLRVVVDDTTGGVGAVWESADGGNSWVQVTALTNTGYNTAYWSGIDDNLAFLGGDGGVLHQLATKTS